MNHQEKDELIAKLKEEVRELKEKSKTASKIESNLKSLAVSVAKVGKEFFLVELMYDFDSGIAKVSNYNKLGTAWHVAAYRAKEFLIKRIVDKVDRK